MATDFNPYHKWLGIPPGDQPPHHYRLLDVQAFETDADIIDIGFNRRMAYLRTVKAGSHLDAAEKLKQELFEARRCLLHPGKKAAYDLELKDRLANAGRSSENSSPRNAAANHSPGVAADFNPYHQWLGIPPADQPPHHYRLLGVDPFESDLQVIELAADCQMAVVRTFQNGPNADLSRRILNELNAAKIALLRPEKKATYDRALHANLAARRVPSRAAAGGGDPSATDSGHAAPVQVAAASRPASQPLSAPTDRPIDARANERLVARPRSTKPAKKSSPLPWILSGFGVLLMAAVAGNVVLSRSDADKDVAEAKSTPEATTAEPEPAKTEPPAVSQAKPKKAKRPKGNDENLRSTAEPGNEFSDPVAAPVTPNAKPRIPAGSAPIKAAIGKPIDLLKLIDLSRDPMGQGQWHRVGDSLVSPMTRIGVGGWNPAADGGPRIRISSVPLSPTYRLNLDARTRSSGGSLVIGLPVGDQTRIAVIDGKNPTSNDINHRLVFPGRGPNEWIVSNAVYRFQASHTARVSILVTPQSWRFEIDGKTYFEFASQMSRSWNSWSVRDQPAIFVGCYNGGFRFSKLELTNLGELPPPAPPAKSVETITPGSQSPAPPQGNTTPLATLSIARTEPPSAESRSQAVARIREIYRDDYKDVGAAARTALAAKLAKLAEDGGNSPADRYVLLEEAATLAAAGNDMSWAATLLTTLGKSFAVNEQSMKLKLAAQTLEQAVTNQQRSALLTQLQILAEYEAQNQHYAQGNDWFELALDSAKTMKNANLTKQLKQSAADLKELTKRHEEAEVAKKQLAAQPDFPEAHLVLGKFLCFMRDDWREGLSHLVQGSDKPLGEAANRDLQTSTDTTDQLAMGDAWFLLALKNAYPESDRNAMHQRASSWYTKALPQLRVKDKARVQARLTKYPLVAKSGNIAAISSGPEKTAAIGPNPVGAVFAAGMQRRLAEWVLKTGLNSSVEVSVGAGTRDCSNASQLPQGSFDIVGVRLASMPFVRQHFGQEFNLLASLPNLRTLSVSSHKFPISDDEARIIGQSRKLTNLRVYSGFVSPELACGEIGKLTELQSLTISNSNVSDGLANLLPNLAKLNNLQLDGSGVSNASLPAIGTLSSLTSLSLEATPITDAGMVHLQGLSNLNSLYLTQTQVTDAGLKNLSKLTSISMLRLSDTKVSGEGIKHVAPLTNLKHLVLDNTAISDQDVRSLNGFTQLVDLSIRHTAITDDGLKQLNDLKQLRYIHAPDTQITPAGAQAFTDLHPNCKVNIR